MNASNSEKLFFSSSPSEQTTLDPGNEVNRLIEDALDIDQLSSSLQQTIKDNQAAFFNTFQRQINLIKSRSQVFSNHQVTVFDKTLLILTEDGAVLNKPAAIAFFCEEFLGISPNSSSNHQTTTVEDAATASAVIFQGMPTPTRHACCNSSLII